MNEKGILYYLKKKFEQLLIFLHLKKRQEDEEKKKKQEVCMRSSKPKVFGKVFLGFFLGVIEYAANRPKSKPQKELVDLDEINEEIKNLEKKIEWLEQKILKERRHDKRKAYQNKLNHTKNVIYELEERTKVIKYNKEKAEEVKKKLDKILLEMEEIQEEVNQIKSHISTTKEPEKLKLYQRELTRKQEIVKGKINQIEQIKKDYDRFSHVDLDLNNVEQDMKEVYEENPKIVLSNTKDLNPVKETLEKEVPKVLPLTKYLEDEIVETIVSTNKKASLLTKEVEKEIVETKKEAKQKQEEEEERIRKEAEERLNREVNEVKEAEERINTHVKETNDEIEKLRKEVDKAKKVVTKENKHFRGISKMIVNVSKMAVGLLSFTFFKNPGVGLVIGSVILNNSIRGLRNAVRLNKRRIAYYKYTDVTYEILKQKSTLKVSQKLMKDSLKQIASFKAEFQEKFDSRIKDLPEFKEILEKVEIVEREILLRQEELMKQKKALNEIEKKNEKHKQKVKQES